MITIDEKKSHFAVLDFDDNPNLGVYCKTNDKIAFIRKGLAKKIKNIIINTLDIDLIELSIADATIIGSLIAMNSKGVVVADFIDDEALKIIQDQGFEIYVIKDTLNAAGNDILVNDKGAIVHPDISDESINEIRDILKVPVKRGTIASLKTIGMTAVVTNKGLLCHPKITEEEKHNLEKIFQVNVMIGTVNHGSPIIGSGLVANTKGAIIGNLTTGIEMGRIEEALGFLD